MTIQKLQNIISKRIIRQGVCDTTESDFSIAVSCVRIDFGIVTTACVPIKANC